MDVHPERAQDAAKVVAAFGQFESAIDELGLDDIYIGMQRLTFGIIPDIRIAFTTARGEAAGVLRKIRERVSALLPGDRVRLEEVTSPDGKPALRAIIEGGFTLEIRAITDTLLVSALNPVAFRDAGEAITAQEPGFFAEQIGSRDIYHRLQSAVEYALYFNVQAMGDIARSYLPVMAALEEVKSLGITMSDLEEVLNLLSFKLLLAQRSERAAEQQVCVDSLSLVW